MNENKNWWDRPLDIIERFVSVYKSISDPDYYFIGLRFHFLRLGCGFYEYDKQKCLLVRAPFIVIKVESSLYIRILSQKISYTPYLRLTPKLHFNLSSVDVFLIILHNMLYDFLSAFVNILVKVDISNPSNYRFKERKHNKYIDILYSDNSLMLQFKKDASITSKIVALISYAPVFFLRLPYHIVWACQNTIVNCGYRAVMGISNTVLNLPSLYCSGNKSIRSEELNSGKGYECAAVFGKFYDYLFGIDKSSTP